MRAENAFEKETQDKWTFSETLEMTLSFLHGLTVWRSKLVFKHLLKKHRGLKKKNVGGAAEWMLRLVLAGRQEAWKKTREELHG